MDQTAAGLNASAAIQADGLESTIRDTPYWFKDASPGRDAAAAHDASGAVAVAADDANGVDANVAAAEAEGHRRNPGRPHSRRY